MSFTFFHNLSTYFQYKFVNIDVFVNMPNKYSVSEKERGEITIYLRSCWRCGIGTVFVSEESLSVRDVLRIRNSYRSSVDLWQSNSYCYTTIWGWGNKHCCYSYLIVIVIIHSCKRLIRRLSIFLGLLCSYRGCKYTDSLWGSSMVILSLFTMCRGTCPANKGVLTSDSKWTDWFTLISPKYLLCWKLVEIAYSWERLDLKNGNSKSRKTKKLGHVSKSEKSQILNLVVSYVLNILETIIWFLPKISLTRGCYVNTGMKI